MRRIHGFSSSSRMAILQQRNYVLITRHDFETYDRNPHELMELSFREPQLHTTVLSQMLNLPILRSFLASLLDVLTTLACSSKMVAQSPQAYRISQGENRTAALPQLRIYWTASGAFHHLDLRLLGQNRGILAEVTH